MTRTLQAGLAAALSLVVSFATPATAADLGGWGRGSIKDGGPAPSHSSAGPCYFRADVGHSWSAKPELRWSALNAGLLTERVTNSKMGDAWTGGVGAGCGTGSRGFRYEAMFGYHGERSIDGMTSPYSNGVTVASRPIHSSVTSYTGMVNGYFDLGSIRGLVPYIGAGVGLAYHQMDDYSLPVLGSVPYRVKGDNDLTLAWSLMTGFAYQVSDRAILDIGYRYIDLGRAATSRTDNFGFTPSKLSVDDMSAHEIKIGLRYHFGGDSCCTAQHAALK